MIALGYNGFGGAPSNSSGSAIELTAAAGIKRRGAAIKMVLPGLAHRIGSVPGGRKRKTQAAVEPTTPAAGRRKRA